MSRSSILTVISGILLGMVVVSVAIAHRSYIEACVCVVNSSARAAVFLGLTVSLGAIIGLGSFIPPRAQKGLEAMQAVSFIVALFFLVQHVFFVLELA